MDKNIEEKILHLEKKIKEIEALFEKSTFLEESFTSSKILKRETVFQGDVLFKGKVEYLDENNNKISLI